MPLPLCSKYASYFAPKQIAAEGLDKHIYAIVGATNYRCPLLADDVMGKSPAAHADQVKGCKNYLGKRHEKDPKYDDDCRANGPSTVPKNPCYVSSRCSVCTRRRGKLPEYVVLVANYETFAITHAQVSTAQHPLPATPPKCGVRSLSRACRPRARAEARQRENDLAATTSKV